MTDAPTPEHVKAPVCGHCGFPIHPADTGLRHLGWYTAHHESTCRDLLKAEIERLRAALTEAEAKVAMVERLRAAGMHKHIILGMEEFLAFAALIERMAGLTSAK